MANGHGGYRRPANPAPVSGPGSLSQRTDGGPTNPQPAMGGQMPDAAGMSGGAPIDTSGLVPLDAPTQRPAEPISAGAPFGAGPGLESIGVNPKAMAMDPDTKERIRSYMPVLMHLASKPGASRATRQFVRQLRGELL